MRVKFFFRSFYFVFFVLLFENCNEPGKEQIENNLGIQISDTLVNIKYYKHNFSSDNIKPYNIFIKFKLDSTGVQRIIDSTGLISYSSDFKKSMCLENTDNILLRQIWNFDRSEMGANEIDWWNPYFEKNHLYASFFRASGNKKIINCFKDEWDGFILLAYDKNNNDVYILIRVLME